MTHDESFLFLFVFRLRDPHVLEVVQSFFSWVLYFSVLFAALFLGY